MATQLESIEFVGGPLDGYEEMVSIRHDDLAGMVAVPVNSNVFRMLDGRGREAKRPPTSVAIYARQVLAGRNRYQFLGSASPAEESIEASWV